MKGLDIYQRVTEVERVSSSIMNGLKNDIKKNQPV